MLFPRLRDPYVSQKRLRSRAAFLLEAQGPLGLDAWCPSLTDLRLGIQTITRLSARAKIPVLAANLSAGAGPGPFLDHRIVVRGGVRVGLFGLIGDRKGAAAPAGLNLEDPVATARRQVDALGPKTDLIVCLSNLGLERDRQLAEQVPGIGLIIGAGDDRMILMPRRVGDSLILQPYKKGEYLGLLELRLTDRPMPLMDEHRRGRLQRQLAKLKPGSPERPDLDRQLEAFTGRSTCKAVLRPLDEDLPEDEALAKRVRAQLAAERRLDAAGEAHSGSK
jgi:2',3'-cyclic-nucleotide 2'-phosphodiesterase (5'-nucleotidase family)